ncbi:uncharacterized protein LOC126471004 [Schistocerca serialis cubense]|uniref:uncharacterized protein LOC126471004 n=1 Tax=Schistocerca serialis cubense TaxID=2023355 RepID=UPI00214E308A|nr:uncharacterized protein LOC126471004 [Schistocerca serialis cubense]
MIIALPSPNENTFKHVEQDFWRKWHTPNCMDSMDGKHVLIKEPKNSRYMDSNGKERDSRIFQKFEMGKKIAKNNFNFPVSKCLPNSDIFMDHFIPGDEAFALSN